MAWQRVTRVPLRPCAVFEKLDDDDSGALDLEEISGAIEKVGCDLEPND
eukprot:COSAG01_NODE_43327_length_430_cov_206.549849_1_plen_48_part_01